MNKRIVDLLLSAVDRSISHTERVHVAVPDLDAAYMELATHPDLDDVDTATETDGSLDAWGTRDGQSWRLNLY